MNHGTPDQWRRRPDQPAKERAELCCAAMTFEEKVAVALGDFEAVAHLAIPPLRYTDGPNGIRGPDNVTAFPASLALAATFDEGLAAAYGTAVASEARDTGSNVLLGPAVDIARVPLGGRLPEAMGEDPYLAGRLAAAEIRAIQDRHVIAMVKHFIGNNAETERTGYATGSGRTPAINTMVGERALQAWLPGQQFGEALAAVLFGDTDPGGRLPVTFLATPDQGPITGPGRWPGIDGDARYDEGVLVGYRWYDQHGQEPLFPFGHGMSYGEYEYGQPRIAYEEATGAVTVSLEVTNVGARAGAEVVQLYLAAPASAAQPPKRLKGFARIHLGPGATMEVSLKLVRDDLAAFDEASGEWIVHQGRYEVLVGRSSRDIRRRAGFEVGARTPVP